MLAHAEALTGRGGLRHAGEPSHLRVQSVRPHEVPGAHAGRSDAVGVLLELVHPPLLERHADLAGAIAEAVVQVGPPHSSARPGREARAHGPLPRDVADAHEVASRRIDSEGLEVVQRIGHEPLAAGLVDGTRSRFDDGDVEAAQAGADGGRQAHRAAAGDQEVDHGDGAGSVASAAFSTRRRTASSGRLRTVKTSAVTQAKPTMGRAIPSMTTAT